MVAVFTGLGAGFERGSAAQIGSAGLLGGGVQGRGGDRISVNAATGNLLINRQDEFLVGRGPDVGISRTYNSLGALDENGDHWRQSTDRRIHSAGATQNVNGATVTRVSADGSEIIYTYDSTYSFVDVNENTVTGAYRATDGSGAHDYLVYNQGAWKQYNGDSGVEEFFTAVSGLTDWRIARVQDRDNNQVNFTYSGGKLDKITTADGGYLKYTWSGNNITSIETYAAGGTTKTLTRTHYTYDGSDRLIKVITDLTPENNVAITTGSGAALAGVQNESYVTTYTYHGATKRIASINQTDGSKLEMVYDTEGRVTNIKQTVAAGDVRETGISYTGFTTSITAPSGEVTKLYHDQKGQLLQLVTPPAKTGDLSLIFQYEYDDVGNLIRTVETEGTLFAADANFNSQGGGNNLVNLTGLSQSIQNLISSPAASSSNLVQTADWPTSLDGTETDATVDGWLNASYLASDNEAQWIETDGPDGEPVIALEAGQFDTGGNGGGQHTNAFTIDGSKSYRFTQYVRKTDLSKHSIYFGLSSNYDNPYVRFAHSGADAKNPYFMSINKTTQTNHLDENKWYKVEGYVLAEGSALIGRSELGGVFDAETGEKVLDVSSFIWHEDRANDSVRARFFNYYDQDDHGWSTQFLAPEVTEVDATVAGWSNVSWASSDNEAQWIETDGPNGESVTALQAGQFDDLQDGGGQYTNYFDIDKTKAYKFTQYMRLTDIKHSAYFGLSGSVSNAASGDGDTNPYFISMAPGVQEANLDEDKWYKVEAYVLANGSPLIDANSLGGVFDTETGEKVFNVKNFAWGDDATQARARFFTYYSHTDHGWSTQFLAPEVTQVDATVDGWLNASYLASDNEAQWIETDGPDGEPVIALEAGQFDTGGNGGGQHTNAFTIDGSKSYRFTQYVRKTDLSKHSIYFGLSSNYDNPYVRFAHSGADAKNPYFMSINKTTQTNHLDENKWYKVEGYVLAEGSALIGRSELGGVFDAETGEKVLDVSSFIWHEDRANDSVRARFFNYYDQDDHGWSTQFLAPEVTELGGSNETSNVTLDYADDGLSAVFTYDGEGNVLTATDVLGQVTTYSYDANNNLTRVQYKGSYDSSSDGWMYSHNVYDSENHLRYSISAEGHVTEFEYDLSGGHTYTKTYSGKAYSIVAASPDLVQMNAWVTGLSASEKTQINITRHLLNTKDQAERTITYGTATNTGYQAISDGYTDSYYTYDSAGRLLTSRIAGVNTQTFVYDGLGRQISTTDSDGGLTTITFNDAATTTRITNSINGVTVSTYNKAGDLLSATSSGAFHNAGTSNFKHDALGRVRVTTDATGVESYMLYDQAGNMTASINDFGHIMEYRYDINGRVIATVNYTATDGLSAGEKTVLADPENTLTIADIRPAAHSYDIWSWTAYDAKGQVTRTALGDGSITTYAYDNAGRLTQTKTYYNKLSATQLTALRDGANLSVQALPAGNGRDAVIKTFYNRDGQVIGSLNAEGYLTEITYDEAGRQVKSTDYASKPTSGTTFAQLLANTPKNAAKDITTRSVYNGQGDLRFSIDALGKVTEYFYGVNSAAFGPVRSTVQHTETLSLGSGATYDLTTVKAAVASLGSSSTNRTSWAVYNTAGRAVYTIDASGAVSHLKYDTLGNVTKVTQFAKTRSTPSLPTEGTMNSWAANSVNKADARITRNYYSAQGQLRFTVDAEGYVTRTDYDNAGRVYDTYSWSGVITPTDSWTTANVNNAAKGTSVRTMAYRYDAAGRISSTYDANSTRSLTTYYANGEVEWDIRAYGQGRDESRILHVNDAAGRLKHKFEYSVGASGARNQTNYTYDGLGNLTQVVETQGTHAYVTANQVTNFEYDKSGNLTKQTNAEGGITRFEYNAFGQVTKTTDPKGYFSTNTYDKGGRLTRTTDALNYHTDFTYTAFNEQATVKRNNATTTFTYDNLGQVTRVTDALGGYEAYTYTAFGQQASVRNKLGGYTYYTYDKRGQMSESRVVADIYNSAGTKVSPNITTHYHYDSRGNQTKMIEAVNRPAAEQRTTTYVYDNADRLIQKKGDAVSVYTSGADSSAATVTPTEYYTYDRRGNLIESKDANGARTLYFYDRMDRVTHQISPEGTLVRNFYDANSNLMETRVYANKVTLPSNALGTPPAGSGTYRRTTFTYDRLNRMTNSYVHDVQTAKFGTSLSITATTNDLRTQYQYDANGNVTKVIDPNGGQTTSAYDKLGRKTSQVDAGGFTTSWAYNADGNVTREIRYGTGADAHRITDFTYDKNGNRLTEKRLSVKVFNGSTGETTAHSTISYLYNALGQVTRKTEATGEYIDYAYDAQGRLNYETRSGYTDHLGGSVRAKVQYLYNGLNDVSRVFKYGKTGSISHSDSHYTYAKGGRLTSVTDNNGFVRTYRYDAKGQMVREEYVRVTNGASQTEGIGYDFDKEGRVTAQGAVVKSGSTWSRGGAALDTVNTKYNAFGDVSERGINGKYSEKMDYDKAGRLWRTTSGDGAYKYFMYDNNGNQSLVFISDGRNIDNKSIAQILAIWGVSSNGANANRISTDYETDITAVITKYDARNLAIEVREPEREYHNAAGTKIRADFTTQRDYNAFGEVISETDANNKTITYSYNTMGRRIKVVSPQIEIANTSNPNAPTLTNPTEHYYYDISGRLVASSDANGNVTRQTLLAGTGYNGTQALISKVENVLSNGTVYATVQTQYDIQGNARKITDQLGRVTTNSFDKMGNLTQINHASGLIDSYAYDGLGQQIKRYNNVYGSGNTEQTSYDAQGRIVVQRAIGGDTTSTSYTWSGTGVLAGTGGWLETTTLANGKQSKLYKNVFNQAVQSYDLENRQVNYTYDKGGRLIEASGAGLDTQTYHYLNTSKLDKLVLSNAVYSNRTVDRVTDYGYDKVGNLTFEKFHQTTTTHHDDDYYEDYDEAVDYDDYQGTYQEFLDENGLVPGTYTIITNITLQNARATYDALGRVKSWTELGTEVQSGFTTNVPAASKVFEYDSQGNIRRTTSTFRTLDAQGEASSTATTKETWYNFDAMNRVTTAEGQLVGGQVVRGSTGVDIAYDAAGQRAYTVKDTVTYHPGGYPDWVYEDYYDAQDYDDYDGTFEEFVADNGYTPGPPSTTTTTTRENYTYNAGGQVTQVNVATTTDGTMPSATGTRRSVMAYDTLGRQTSQKDYEANGTTVAFQSTKIYNAKSQVTNDTSITKRSDGTFKGVTTYAYGYGTSYALGAATTVTTANYKNNSHENTSRTTNTYDYYNGAALKRTTFDGNINSSSDRISTTYYTNSKSGILLSARVSDGRARTVSFTVDNQGQTLRRDERDYKAGGDPHEIWYRYGGKEMGYVGNNGSYNTAFAQSITDRTTRPTTGTNAGAFKHGRTTHTSHADFDQAFQAINSYKQGSSSGTYTVRGGDTLQGIAANIYGDSSLWYKIAAANGMTGEAALIEGQALNLPSGVVKSTHNASTFKPYSPGDIQGDLNPTTPQPQQQASAKGKKCGVLGQILLVVVAVAVAVVTAGAGAAIAGAVGLSGTAATVVGGAIAAVAGSVASQAVGLVTGIQEKFSWKGVALAAISGGVGAGLGGLSGLDKFGTFGAGAIKGALGSAISQGIGVATGLQETFSWAGVAAAGVGGGIGALAGKHLPGAETRTSQGSLKTRATFANRIGSSGAAAIASAATTSAISGTNFGDNLMAALPNVIGQALGTALGKSLHKGACFVAETEVHTPNGLKRIDEIKVGDWVYSRDENFLDDKVHVKRVIELYRFEDRTTMDVSIAFADGSETSLRTTPEHPFAIINGIKDDDAHSIMQGNVDTAIKTETTYAWSTAADLKVGSRVIDIKGRVGLVTELAHVGTLSTVHNFAVEDFHTYYVSNIGIWVHNEYTAKEHAEMIKRNAEFDSTVFPGEATFGKQGNHGTAAGGRLSLLKMRDMELYEAVVAELGAMPAENSFGLGYSTRYASGTETFADLVPSLEAEFQAYVQRGVERSIDNTKFIDGFFDGTSSFNHIKGIASESGKFNPHVFASGVSALGHGTDQQVANPEVAMQALGMLLGDESISIANVIGVFDSLNMATGSEIAHNFFAVGGFIPVIGAAFDTADGLLYAYEGRPGMAALSFAAAVPGWGDAAAAGRFGVKMAGLSAKASNATFKATEALYKMAGRACFAAGTPVLTKEGLKPIEEIREGDLVWSRSEFDEGETTWRKVLVAEATGEKIIYEVTIKDATGSKVETLRTTEEHPFWSETRGLEDGQGDFIVASELKPGEQLRLHDGSSAYVISVRKTDVIETVYNFTVDGFHTYHVGELGVWVHNQCLAAKIRNYAHALKMRTGMNMPKAQIESLKAALRSNDYTAKLTGAAWDTHKAGYTRAQRNQMIKQWENANGKDWPRYANDVINPDTNKVVRKAGARYDLHHIIEKQYGGPHTWWNSAPLHVTDHTFKGGIHYTDASKALFGN